MIGISDVYAGWANLTIGYCSFAVSYLSSLIDELDELLNLEDDRDVRKITLEGESDGDLCLVSHLTFENVNSYLPRSRQRDKGERFDYVINIMWQRVLCGNDHSFSLLKFPFKEFKEQYLDIRNDEMFKNNYIDNFLVPATNEERKELRKHYEERKGI